LVVTASRRQPDPSGPPCGYGESDTRPPVSTRSRRMAGWRDGTGDHRHVAPCLPRGRLLPPQGSRRPM